MCSAVPLRDVIREAEDAFVIAVVPPQRCFDRNALPFGFNENRLGEKRSTRPVEILNERLQTALIPQLALDRFDAAQIREDNVNSGVQERQLPQTVLKRRVIEFHH